MATGNLDLTSAVEKAVARAADLDTDLDTLTRRVRDAKPDDLNSAAQKRQRRDFLRSIYDESKEADQAYERIIGNNELQDASYLARGVLVSRAVMRVVLRRPGGALRGYGTGFLVANRVLITNNHVLRNPDEARNAEAEAHYERGLIGEEVATRSFLFDPDALFHTSEELDFTVVAVAARDRTGTAALSSLGWLPLIGTTGKVMEGEWLTILQHPKGERKQLCVRENQLLRCDDDVLWYSTDTLGGSSGSPVLTNDWLVVALHHSGVPETRDGKWQTVDGRDYDRLRDGEDQIRWKANEGIRVSRIVGALRADNKAANNPLVKPMLETSFADIRARLPVMFEAAQVPQDCFPAILPTMLINAAAAASGAAPIPPVPGPAPASKESEMTTRRVTLTLEIDDSGSVSLVGGGAAEADLLEAAGKPKKNLIFAPVKPEDDWVHGYDPNFLQPKDKPRSNDLRVNLPVVTQTEKIAPLRNFYGQTFNPEESAAGVLHYKGYSVVMHKERRLAFYSAANIDGGMRPQISGREDDWLFDDRILREHQIDNSYYKNNKLDRGHLTRRDDMEWGDDPIDAVNRANGTCTWTNCSPQQEIFNQGRDKGVLLWQNLEKYVLEQTAAHHQFKAQVITGPVLGGADPKYRELPIPLEFWKVVAAVTSQGRLFATAYLLSQKDTIDKFGVEAAVEEPFGAFGTYQCRIAVIENLTGLKFTFGAGKPLSRVDPLEGPRAAPRPKAGGAGAAESFALGGSAGGGAPLSSLEQIVLF